MENKKTILLLSVNPQNTVRLRLDEEVREIQEGLKRSKFRDIFVIQQAWAVRLRDLRRALLEYEPQIVHFCGHGDINGIIVENDHGNAMIVDSDALSGLFKLFTQIECVVLNACYSESQANAITNYIPYVIGMQQEIADKAGIEFAIGFYDALGAGRDIEKSFEFGCNAINLYGISNSSNPILKKKSLPSQTIKEDISTNNHEIFQFEKKYYNKYVDFNYETDESFSSILKYPPERVSNILNKANIYFDPCYDLEYYYNKLDILVLLFDHVLLHSPQKWHFLTGGKLDVQQTSYNHERFLQFVERGFIIPCTVLHPEEIWDPRKQGEFGRRILISKNYIFKKDMADIHLYENLRSKFDQIDGDDRIVYDILSKNGWEYCYADIQELQKHNDDPEFGIKRFIHEINGDFLFTKLINTPELLKPNFLPIWRYKINKFTGLCCNKKDIASISADDFTEILSKDNEFYAFIDFIKTKKIIIPKNLSIKQIEQFRNEGESESLRKFLRNAYENSQNMKELPFDVTLIDDFNSLWSGYVGKRDTFTVTLQSFIGSALIGYATHINPALGAGVAAGVAGMWGATSKMIRSSLNKIGRKFSDSSWMLYFLKEEV